MAKFQVNILGCGSATPSMRHMPSCQVIDFRDNLFMIDCGEGAQLMMRRMKMKFSRLNHIFISHLHGDHCYGLPGLLSTLALHGKEGVLTIHMFKEGAEVFEHFLKFFCRDISFEIKFNIIEPGTSVIYEDDALTISTFPLYHRLPCVGFKFQEKTKLRHLRGDMIKFYNVPIKELHGIRNGADFITPDGKIVENARLTTDADPSMSYAYCSDTMYNLKVAESVKGVDVVYHEATYDDAEQKKAVERGHSTAREAGRIAAAAGASKLILGHFSKRYNNENTHLVQAQEEFPDVIVANEGMKIDLL
ncbi:MAG: ribonuclease Z [Muribaculaceae bacterium]|nr:ribonuclease Z [Muribaculaceae bacterium]